MLAVLEIEKVGKNWLTPNYKNGVHHKKKVLNKHKLYNLPKICFLLPEWSTVSLNRKTASIRISVWKIWRRRFPLTELRFFCNNEFKKIWLKKYGFKKYEWKNIVSTDHNKGFSLNKFPRDTKTASSGSYLRNWYKMLSNNQRINFH